MNWYRFGLSRKEIKKGPRGPPGIGFKLTDDGNYDIEKKKLKNVDDPVDISDVATKSYVDSNKIQLKSDIVELQKRSLIHSEHGDFDAKGKIIGNVKDPVHDMNVVNKQYLEKNALILNPKTNILQERLKPQENEEFYDLKSIPLKNLPNPRDKNDAVSKQYVDKKTKINDKKPDNQLMKNADGFYVECKDFWATIKEDFQTFEGQGTKNVNFNLMSSKLLDENLKLSTDMYMKITIYLKFDTLHILNKPDPYIELKLNDKVILCGGIYGKDSVSCFTEGKQNDVISLKILQETNPTYDYKRIKTFMHIENLNL